MTKKKSLFKKDENQVEGQEATEVDEEFEGELALDVYQDDNNVYVTSMMAGVSPDNIDISINGDMLTIKGERSNSQEVKEDDYFYQECYWGGFSRSVILPVEVEVDKISAELKDGILKVKLPKSKKAKSRKITVKMAG